MKDATASAFKSALSATASRVGYEIVGDPTAPADIAAVPEIRLSWCRTWEGGRIGGVPTVTLRAAGKQIGILTPSKITEMSDGDRHMPVEDWAAAYANAVVNDLNNSQQLMAYAKSPHERVAQQAQPAAPASASAAASNAAPATGMSAFLTATPQPAAYALIIGIEKYRDVPAPTGARADAESFAALARQTLGVPQDQIVTAYDDRASRADLLKHLRWLKGNVKPGGRVYFFYSGHGAPEPSSGTSYLLPFDGDPSALDETAIKLSDLLKQLGDTGAKQVLAVVDSCFSGAGGRSVLPKGARPLVRVKETPVAAQIAVLSAASGAEISGPGPDGTGGLFTHHLTRGIGSGEADANGDGQISLKEVYDWVKPRVSRDAKIANRDQNPGMLLGTGAGRPGDFMIAWGIAKR